MSADTADVAERLGAALGGRVARVRRLSGGASRVTSAFDLETPSGEVRALILQRVRGVASAEADPMSGWRRACCGPPARPGFPCPE